MVSTLVAPSSATAALASGSRTTIASWRPIDLKSWAMTASATDPKIGRCGPSPLLLALLLDLAVSGLASSL